MLSEECGEVVQIIGKILRHGYESYHPDDEQKTPNREHLSNEVADLRSVVCLMLAKGDFTMTDEQVLETGLRKMKYTHHQGV